MSDNKIIFWDLETSHIIARTWSLWPKSINHTDIIRDWYIICASFKELGKDRVYSLTVDAKDHENDYQLCKTLRDYLVDTDVLIAHNGDRFDLKKFNARLMFHDIDPLPTIASVDTLKEIKKVSRHTSHRLDFLNKSMRIGAKYSTSKGLWIRCEDGDAEAIKEMAHYCDIDVVELEKLYLRTRKYYKSHVNIADAGSLNCPKCNSDIHTLNQRRLTTSGITREQYKCSSCGSYFTKRKSNKEKPLSKL